MYYNEARTIAKMLSLAAREPRVSFTERQVTKAGRNRGYAVLCESDDGDAVFINSAEEAVRCIEAWAINSGKAAA